MRPQQQQRRPHSIAPDTRLPSKILSPSAAFTWSVRACGVLRSLRARRRAVCGEQALEGALEPAALQNYDSIMSSWQASGLLVHSGAGAVLVPSNSHVLARVVLFDLLAVEVAFKEQQVEERAAGLLKIAQKRRTAIPEI